MRFKEKIVNGFARVCLANGYKDELVAILKKGKVKPVLMDQYFEHDSE